jgi:hypothetical protein
VAKTDDVFMVFIRHKQDDHTLAVEVKRALEGLAARPKQIDCFVSGVNRRGADREPPRQGPPLLLFTAPSRNWGSGPCGSWRRRRRLGLHSQRGLMRLS